MKAEMKACLISLIILTSLFYANLCLGEANESKKEVAKRLYEQGLRLAHRQNFSAAISEFKKALEITPDDVEIRYVLGRVYFIDLGKFDEAIAEFKKVIELSPKHAQVHHMLGVVYLKQNRYDEAENQFHQAIQLEPKNMDSTFDPYYGLGMAYLKKERYEAAIKAFQHAIELDPEHASAHYGLATVYIRQGNYAEGAKEMDTFRKLKPYVDEITRYQMETLRKPEGADMWHELGVAYARHDRFEKALEPVKKAIQLNPNKAIYYNTLAKLCLMLKKLDEMQKACESAIRLAPEDASSHNYLGICFFEQGKFDLAAKSFESAIRLDPKNADFHENLAKTYQKMGKQKGGHKR